MSDASPEICELDVASYQIVQSLWDHLPALQDWECLTEFLLKSESLPTKGKRKAQTDHVELSEIQQTFLAYILSACAQHCMPMVVVEYMEPEYVKNAKTLVMILLIRIFYLSLFFPSNRKKVRRNLPNILRNNCLNC